MCRPEKVIQSEILKFLNSIDKLWCVKTIASNKKGIPDILACYNGKFYAFEVKNEKGRTSKIQDYQIEQIRKSGGIVYVVRSVNDVKAALNEPHN